MHYPNVVIDDHCAPVSIDETAKIMHGVTLVGPLTIGANVRIYTGACIGCDAEYKGRASNWKTPMVISAGTTIRENVVIQRGVDDATTTIGKNCYLMHGCHVAHDCHLGDDVTMAPRTVLGGHTTVCDGAYLGIASCTHQFCTIGHCAMVGMGAVVIGDVRPGSTVAGNPARIIGSNTIGLSRAGNPDIEQLTAEWADARRGRKEVE